MKAQQQSLLYLHLAVLLFGGTALFSKLITLSALDITFYRATVAAIALFLLLILQNKKIKLLSIKDYCIAILLGVVVGIHWITYFAGMQMAGIAIGMIAFFTYPVITVFMEPLFNKSKPKIKDLLSAVIVIFGVYLLIPDINLGNQITLGIVTGISSAFFFSLRNIIHKNYFSHYSGSHTMFYQTLVVSIMLLVFIDVKPTYISSSNGLLILLVGVVFTALPHALFASSLRHLSATTVGLISCLQPLYGSILAFVLLQEKVNIETVIGGALIVSAAIFETWSVSQSKNIK